MPDETNPTESANVPTDASDTQTKDTSDHAPPEDGQEASEALAEAHTIDASNLAPSDDKKAKADELEVPEDIQTWPDEKPPISKEDEDRLLKVRLSSTTCTSLYM